MPNLHTIHLSPERPRLSVVFVHGSNGHYLQTWEEDGSSSWMRWLSEDADSIDVFSVQHEANLLSFSDYATISEYAEVIEHALEITLRTQQVLFVCHSLGGIIVKEMICQRYSRGGQGHFATNKFDICFIATPHLGTNFKLLRYVPNRIAAIIGSSSEIQAINARFLEISDNAIGKGLCVAERRRLWGMVKLLPDASAFIANKKFKNLAVSKDHRKVCKLEPVLN